MSKLQSRLAKLEAKKWLMDSLRAEFEGGARQRLMDKVQQIRDRFDAARARGEQVPEPDPGSVKAMLAEFIESRKKRPIQR